MRATRPKMVLPCDEPHKPVKERIVRAANLLFLQFGMIVTIRQIAHLAGTQDAVVVRYFEGQERLRWDFLKSILRQLDQNWEEAEKDNPGDPEAQLRCWIFYTRNEASESQSPSWQIGRMAAQLAYPVSKGMPLQIDLYRQAELRKIETKCEQAKLRNPQELAEKLMLLIEGARNVRGGYEYPGPLKRLCEAADDLIVLHGAVRKPLFDIEDD
jgi:AcrR family transcriptional regulator